jgi:hypothetical protein
MTTKQEPLPKTASKSAQAEKAPTTSRAKKVKRGDRIIALLQPPKGVAIEELIAEFGTKLHTIRAQIWIETRKRSIKAVVKEGRYKVAESRQ